MIHNGQVQKSFILRYVLTWAFPTFVDLKKPRHSLAEIQRGFLITEPEFYSLQKKNDLHLLFTFQKREGLKQYPLLHLTLQATVCSWCWFQRITMRKLLVLLRKMSERECGWDGVQWQCATASAARLGTEAPLQRELQCRGLLLLVEPM